MFVGMPVRDGVHPLTMAGTVTPILHGFGGVLGTVIGSPWVDLARTDLVSQFLATREQELLFVDADIYFDPAIVETMRAACADVLTCTYRKKIAPHAFNLNPLGNQQPHIRRLREASMRLVGGARVIEIESDGLGCTLIARRVIEQLIKKHPELEFVAKDGTRKSWLFQPFIAPDADGLPRPAHDDRAFFLRARAAGFKVECLIDATIFHDGIEGRFGDLFDGHVSAELELGNRRVERAHLSPPGNGAHLSPPARLSPPGNGSTRLSPPEHWASTSTVTHG